MFANSHKLLQNMKLGNSLKIVYNLISSKIMKHSLPKACRLHMLLYRKWVMLKLYHVFEVSNTSNNSRVPIREVLIERLCCNLYTEGRGDVNRNIFVQVFLERRKGTGEVKGQRYCGTRRVGRGPWDSWSWTSAWIRVRMSWWKKTIILELKINDYMLWRHLKHFY